MKFKIITLGCKVNTYESEYMLEHLICSGYILCNDNPDIIIINTCSVTNEADKKSLKTIRKLKRENPHSIFVVCGCSSENNREEYTNMDIDILIGNKNKSQIVSIINKYLQDKNKYVYFSPKRVTDFEDMQVAKFTTHTRAFMKIEDGCDNFCSYCIIPYTRGHVRSKDFNIAIEEAKTLVKNKHKEIVLTGIHTGAYSSGNHDLSDLITELAKIEGLERIRISSIEITELNAKFLEVLKNTPKICNHLHIPLQSGSDNTLKRMNRKYDKNYFREKITKIRAIRPDISITTDCIVGHPYETDKDFMEYLEFCEEINFSKIHVFPYSIRANTAASLMPQVDATTKKTRTRKLLELSRKLETDYIKKFIGTTCEVITEEYYNNYVIGHTSNYLKVLISGDYKLNQTYLCKLTSFEDNYLYGEVITCKNMQNN